MGDTVSDEERFPIGPHDLEPLIDLLIRQKPYIEGEVLEHTKRIVDDLLKLPNADIGPFSITLLSRFRADDPNVGHGSDWISMEATDEQLSFSVGSHVYSPGIGGDSSSETMFECWSSGGSMGDLHVWLSALAPMDRSLIEISAVHENIGNEIARYDNLIAAYEKARRDPILTQEMRANANRHFNNLKAISRISEPIKSEPEGGEDRSEQVRLDHYAHKFALFAIAAYGWQLHGWFVGLLVLLGLFATISLTNIAILAVASEKRLFTLLRLNRWGWVVIAGVALAYFGASVSAG